MFTSTLSHPLFVVVYIGLMASFALGCSLYYLRCPVDIILVLTSVCIVFGVYTLNRYTDREDTINNFRRKHFFQRHGYLLTVAVLGMVLSATILVVTGRFTAMHAAILTCGAIYSLRIIPWLTKKNTFGFVRLKDFAFAKSVSTSLVWGSSLFAIGWCAFPQYVTDIGELLLLIVSCSLAVFMNTNFADIRDSVGDRAAGVRTIPTVLGESATYAWAIVAPGVVWFAATTALMGSGRIQLTLYAFFLVQLVFPVVYIGLDKWKRFPRALTEPLSDSCILVFAVGLLVLRFAS